MDALKAYFPLLQWLPDYRRRDLRGDLLAGLTVGVMLIPQGMAYAMLAGLPPIYGLYASLVPLLVYPFLGTSRHLAVGIVAIDMLIVSAGLAALAPAGSPRYLGLVFVLALMAGALQMMMGMARLGFIVNLLSRPVIAGFMAAAAITIGFSQLAPLLGLSLPRTSFVHTILYQTARHLNDVHLLTFVIGAAGILVLLLQRRWAPRFPGPILVVVLGTAVVGWFGWDAAGVAIVGEIPSGLPALAFPDLAADDLRALLPTAVTLALVQFMSVISLGKVFAARHRYAVDANRELFALGALNVAGALFQSTPVSGSFSRSAVNEQAGGRTPLANVFAALVVGLTLLFLTPLFYYLPIPAFAAIIMVAAFALVDVDELRFLLRAKRIDGYIALLTFLATLVIGIQEGVLIGIAASVVAIMYRISRPHVAELGHLPGTRSFRDFDRHPEAERIEGILMLRIDASFSFANADFLRDLILDESSDDDHPVRAVVLDASSINDLDTTAAAVLRDVARTLADRDIALYLGGVKGPVLDVIERTALDVLIGKDHFFLSPHRAVTHLLEAWGESADYLDSVPGVTSDDAEPHV